MTAKSMEHHSDTLSSNHYTEWTPPTGTMEHYSSKGMEANANCQQLVSMLVQEGLGYDAACLFFTFFSDMQNENRMSLYSDTYVADAGVDERVADQVKACIAKHVCHDIAQEAASGKMAVAKIQLVCAAWDILHFLINQQGIAGFTLFNLYSRKTLPMLCLNQACKNKCKAILDTEKGMDTWTKAMAADRLLPDPPNSQSRYGLILCNLKWFLPTDLQEGYSEQDLFDYLHITAVMLGRLPVNTTRPEYRFPVEDVQSEFGTPTVGERSEFGSPIEGGQMGVELLAEDGSWQSEPGNGPPGETSLEYTAVEEGSLLA